MASGKNHDKSIYFCSPIVLAIGSSYQLELGLIAASAHLLAGLFLSPDLDLISKPYKRWSLLRWIWIPYQRIVPRHRHWLSHAPVIGSTFRLFYLAACLSPLLLAFPGLAEIEWAMNWEKVAAFLLGVELSALNHLLLDGLLLPLPRGIKQALKGD